MIEKLKLYPQDKRQNEIRLAINALIDAVEELNKKPVVVEKPKAAPAKKAPAKSSSPKK